MGSAALCKELNEPGYCYRISPGHVRATTQTRRQYDDDEARPHVSRIAETCDGSSARELRLHLAAEPGLLKTRRARSDRREARLVNLQSDRPHGDDAQQRRRVPSFRV